MWVFLLMSDQEPTRPPWWALAIIGVLALVALYLGWRPHL